MVFLSVSTVTAAWATEDPLIDAYLKGVDLYRRGDLDAAIPALRQAVRLSEQRFGPESPELALDLNNLAEALRRQGDLREAERLLRRAQAIDQAQDEVDPLAAATTLNNLGLVLAAKGDSRAALTAHRAALAAVEKARGNDHPDTARAAYNLALAEATAGDPRIAQALAARAAFIVDRALGDRHPLTRQMRATEARLRALPTQPPPQAKIAELNGAPEPDDATAVPDAPIRAQRTAALAAVEPAAAPAAIPAAPTTRQRSGEPAAGGGERSFAVQLMALRSEADLDAAWDELRQRFADLAQAQRLPTTSVEIAGRGRFYRLLVGPYAVRTDAERLCSGLKQAGGECRVIIRN
ncbi:SPOR domain-containing protein [Geminicoccus flavidas]|uniref:SPOR domain-containing protein n=1 Tax=Geminicoccus flavidas TaxID=2506407 RepID=UPI00135BE0A7|nr:tetratricopeptide repeat protein [Geminicoccus flavidas]